MVPPSSSLLFGGNHSTSRLKRTTGYHNQPVDSTVTESRTLFPVKFRAWNASTANIVFARIWLVIVEVSQCQLTLFHRNHCMNMRRIVISVRLAVLSCQ